MSDVPRKAPTFPELVWVLKIKPKSTAAAFSHSQTSQKQRAEADNSQNDEEEPERTRVEEDKVGLQLGEMMQRNPGSKVHTLALI